MSQRIFNFSRRPGRAARAGAARGAGARSGTSTTPASASSSTATAAARSRSVIAADRGRLPRARRHPRRLYKVLFLSGGASTPVLHAAGEPAAGRRASPTTSITGAWSQKAIAEAKLLRHACTSRRRRRPPTTTTSRARRRSTGRSGRSTRTSPRTTRSSARSGRTEPTPPPGAWLACDASSDIFSRPIDVTRYGAGLRRRAEEPRPGGRHARDHAARISCERAGARAADHAALPHARQAGLALQHAADASAST